MGFAGVRKRVKRTRWGADLEQETVAQVTSDQAVNNGDNVAVGNDSSRWNRSTGDAKPIEQVGDHVSTSIPSGGSLSDLGQAPSLANATPSTPQIWLSFGKPPIQSGHQQPPDPGGVSLSNSQSGAAAQLLPSVGSSGLTSAGAELAGQTEVINVVSNADGQEIAQASVATELPTSTRLELTADAGTHNEAGTVLDVTAEDQHAFESREEEERDAVLEDGTSNPALKEEDIVDQGGQVAEGEATEIEQAGKSPRPESKPAVSQFCTLVVSSIRPTANEESLKLLFESAGKVLGCKLVRDAASSNQHTGIGFVMMASQVEAEMAAAKFQNFLWGEQRLQVEVKLPTASKVASSGEALPPPPARPQPSWSSYSSAPNSNDAPWASSGSGPTMVPTSSAAPPPDAYAGYGYDQAYYYSGYGYDPAYGGYPTAQQGQEAHARNGYEQAGAEAAEDDRPPGVEDEAAPLRAGDVAMTGLDEDEKPPGVSDDEAPPAPATVQEEPPPPPKKEPTVIRVPLKIPEGARKKQEQRKRAREERARKQEAGIDVGQEMGKAESAQPKVAPVVAEPVTIVKGTFKEVLARRQAEIAALKRLNEKAKTLRRPSPPRRRSRSPFRGRPSRSRSPLRRDPSRSPRRWGRSPSFSRSPNRYKRRLRSRSLSRSYGSLSPRSTSVVSDVSGGTPSRRRSPRPSKRARSKESGLDAPEIAEGPSSEGGGGWLAAPIERRPRQPIHIDPLAPPETRVAGEAVFRKPETSKRRVRTRWQEDEGAMSQSPRDDASGGAGHDEKPPQLRSSQEPGNASILEEGEIELEEGEIEGELGEAPEEEEERHTGRRNRNRRDAWPPDREYSRGRMSRPADDYRDSYRRW